MCKQNEHDLKTLKKKNPGIFCISNLVDDVLHSFVSSYRFWESILKSSKYPACESDSSWNLSFIKSDACREFRSMGNIDSLDMETQQQRTGSYHSYKWCDDKTELPLHLGLKPREHEGTLSGVGRPSLVCHAVRPEAWSPETTFKATKCLCVPWTKHHGFVCNTW